jgi:hypothetical protein
MKIIDGNLRVAASDVANFLGVPATGPGDRRGDAAAAAPA